MSTSLLMFLLFIAITLGITYWASKRSAGASAYFAAGRQIKGWQNGIAVAGDYMSAASFLGIAGIIAFQGYDGFMFSVGWLVAYLTVLLVVAEPLRNAGKYTMADVLAYRLKPRPVRAMASLSTLDRQHLLHDCADGRRRRAGRAAAEGLRHHLSHRGHRRRHSDDRLRGLRRHAGDHVGADHQGHPADGWNHLAQHPGAGAFRFQLCQLLSTPSPTSPITTRRGRWWPKTSSLPGLRYKPPYGALDLISLGLALIFGTAGLPHILVRFYTVPDAKTARHSVVWAMVLIGSFYIMTTFLGFGAATIVGPDFIKTHGGTNMSAPLLAQALAGNIFFAFISAIAFATILAVVAGLTISASTSFAHDFWTNVIHKGVERKPGEEVRVARISAFVVGAVAIAIAILLGPTANVAFLVALAFAVAASANLPVIVLSIFWRRFNTTGAVAGLAVGLLASLALILVGPSLMGIDPPTVSARRGT